MRAWYDEHQTPTSSSSRLAQPHVILPIMRGKSVMDVFWSEKLSSGWVGFQGFCKSQTQYFQHFPYKLFIFPNIPLSNFIAMPQKVFVINSACRAVTLLWLFIEGYRCTQPRLAFREAEAGKGLKLGIPSGWMELSLTKLSTLGNGWGSFSARNKKFGGIISRWCSMFRFSCLLECNIYIHSPNSRFTRLFLASSFN